MKKVINGKTYNTDTAEEVCERLETNGGYYHETLYRSKSNRFFMVGDYGVTSGFNRRFAYDKVEYDHMSNPVRESFVVLTDEQARDFVEQYGTYNDFVEAFGETEAA